MSPLKYFNSHTFLRKDVNQYEPSYLSKKERSIKMIE